MCGIAGIYNLESRIKNQESSNDIKNMLGCLVHRGPDDEGVFESGKIALGHRRLSILDLTKAGHQPMISSDKNLVIVFNGEIYNYREIAVELEELGHKFESSSDTEVILAAYQEWGEQALEKFNGMWALAIYDLKKDELFLSRDRMGVKPLYYFRNENIFAFASEIKALLAHPDVKAKPNDQMIYDYLANGFTDHTEQTFFKGIKQLLPGHRLKITDNGQRTTDNIFWDIDPDKKIELTDEKAAENFRDLFEDSVRMRLRSDVTIGSCLSGGLDSSSIVLAVNELLNKEKESTKSVGERQKTFSAIYKSPEFAKANEKPYMDLVIEKTKVEPHFVEPDPANLWQNIQKLVYAQDEPFNSTSIYAQMMVFKLAGENKMKVMLDGQGADEILGGYLPSLGYYFAELFKTGKWGKLKREISDFKKVHPDFNIKSLYRNMVFALAQGLPNWLYNILSANARKGAISFLDRRFVKKYGHSFKLPRYFKDQFKDFSYWQLKQVSLPSLLRYEDRNSMTYSIESRVPFLDYRLVEFIFALPDSQIIQNGISKWVLRDALKDLLPEAIYNRQDKVGFATPEEIWFKKYIRSNIEELINSESFKNRPYWNYKDLKIYFDEIMSGKRQFDFTIWRWINLELWMREFIDSK